MCRCASSSSSFGSVFEAIVAGNDNLNGQEGTILQYIQTPRLGKAGSIGPARLERHGNRLRGHWSPVTGHRSRHKNESSSVGLVTTSTSAV